MGKIKTWISILIVFIATQSITYSGISFNDVNNSAWFKGDLEYCVNEKLINGYNDGSFKPDKEISKAEFITVVIASVFEKQPNGSTQWYSKSYNKALNHDLINVEFYQSDANQSITREEMAVVISKVLEISDVKFDESKVEEDIKDFNEIEKVNQSAVLNTYKSGIISGFPDGSFRPNETLKRSQLSKVTALMHKLDRKAYNMPAYAEVIDSVEKATVYEKVSDTVEIVEGITFDQKLFADWDDWDEYSMSMRDLELLAIDSVEIDQDEKTITFYVPHVAEGLLWEFSMRGKSIRDNFVGAGFEEIDFNSIAGSIVTISYSNEFSIPIENIKELSFAADLASIEISQQIVNNRSYEFIDFEVR
ncbi:MAG TPA: S-layer homology domain-containing protein [Clostridia bacterium]|nr:S-layer homology domain-containing protein [Clostridia bacterium]